MRFLCLNIMDYLKCLMFLLISVLYAAKVHGKINCTGGNGVKKASLSVIDISKGADVNCSDNFNFSCTFNTSELSKVNCTWKRDGTVVKLDSRYASKVTAKGNNATCIFEVADAKTIDEGNWTCGLLASDENDGVNSANITVNIAQGNKCNNSKETDKGSDKGNLNSPTKSESSPGNMHFILFGASAAVILVLFTLVLSIYHAKQKAKNNNSMKPNERSGPIYEEINENTKNVHPEPGFSLNTIRFKAGPDEKTLQVAEITDQAGYQVPFSRDDSYMKFNLDSGAIVKLALPQSQSITDSPTNQNAMELGNIVAECPTSENVETFHSKSKKTG